MTSIILKLYFLFTEETHFSCLGFLATGKIQLQLKAFDFAVKNKCRFVPVGELLPSFVGTNEKERCSPKSLGLLTCEW